VCLVKLSNNCIIWGEEETDIDTFTAPKINILWIKTKKYTQLSPRVSLLVFPREKRGPGSKRIIIMHPILILQMSQDIVTGKETW